MKGLSFQRNLGFWPFILHKKYIYHPVLPLVYSKQLFKRFSSNLPQSNISRVVHKWIFMLNLPKENR
uniref:Uncharacterized protein n=1 Tax=Arundo donax TaxID=35708 RepID=A0A0A9BYI4_ARUDO